MWSSFLLLSLPLDLCLFRPDDALLLTPTGFISMSSLARLSLVSSAPSSAKLLFLLKQQVRRRMKLSTLPLDLVADVLA